MGVKLKKAVVPTISVVFGTFIIWFCSYICLEVIETKGNAEKIYLSKKDAEIIYVKKSEVKTDKSITELEINHMKDDIREIKDLVVALDGKMDRYFLKQASVDVKCDVRPAVYGYSGH